MSMLSGPEPVIAQYPSTEPPRYPEGGEDQCRHVLHRGSRNPDSLFFGPDEYCDNEVVQGEDYCINHIDEELG